MAAIFADILEFIALYESCCIWKPEAATALFYNAWEHF